MHLVSVGEITIDRYLRQQRAYVGGISLNFAVHARRSGAEQVSLVSCVGADPFGARALALLAQEEVDSSHVAVLPGQTAEIDIVVSDAGERSFPTGGYRANVLADLAITPAGAAFIRRHEIVATQIGAEGPVNQLAQLLALKRSGMRYVVDFGDWSGGRAYSALVDMFAGIDVAFISGEEALAPELAAVARRSNCLVVLTLGAAGSIALTPAGPVTQAAIPVDQVVDVTGCGDAFQAAFTTSYFRDDDVAGALRRGAQQAAGVLAHFGAFAQPGF